jgi:thiosulfate/3-mercaptopyruvate sulfurtransferase
MRFTRLAALSIFVLSVAIRPAPAQQQGFGPLVSTAWLAEQLKSPDLVLLHVGEKAQYDDEHIPGARLVSLRDIAQEGPNRQVLELLPPDTLRRRLEAFGISDNSRIVVYFGRDWITPATRVLYTLDWAGLGARSAFLDGGLPAWKRAGGPVTKESPAPSAGRLSPFTARGSLVVDGDFVRAHIGRPGFKIVDARAANFYDGPAHGDHRAGHVPSAVNIPFNQIGDDRLQVKSRSDLEALFRNAGVAPGDTVIAYCHIGQQATAVVLAARLLGQPVRLYDVSFDDWSRRTEFPVETGKRDK